MKAIGRRVEKLENSLNAGVLDQPYDSYVLLARKEDEAEAARMMRERWPSLQVICPLGGIYTDSLSLEELAADLRLRKPNHVWGGDKAGHDRFMADLTRAYGKGQGDGDQGE